MKEYANSAEPTPDGGLVIAGTILDTATQFSDGFLLKTDSDFNIEWVKGYHLGAFDAIQKVTTTEDHGFLLCGRTTSSLLNPDGMYIIKTDSAGNFIWSKSYAGFEVLDCRRTRDLGYILCGQTIRNSQGSGHGVIALTKIDSACNLQWTRTYGSNNPEWGISAVQTLDGGYIAAGCTFSFGAGVNAICLIRTDSTGNILWSKIYDGNDADFPTCIITTPDSCFIVSGGGTILSGGYRGILMKIDPDGNILWSHAYNCALAGEITRAVLATDHGFIMHYYDGWRNNYLIKTDSAGNQDWVKKLPGTIANESYDYFFSLFETDSNHFILATSADINHDDIYLTKIPGTMNSCSQQITNFQVCNYSPNVSDVLFDTLSTFQQNNLFPAVYNISFYDSSICFHAAINSSENINSKEYFFINVFPDPASDILYISFRSSRKLTVQIEMLNLFGQTIYSVVPENIPMGEYDKKIFIGNISPGIYLIRLITGESEVTRKFMKM